MNWTERSTEGHANRLAWSVIGTLLAIDLVWLTRSAVSVVPLSLATPVGAGIAMGAAAYYYRRHRGELRLADALDTVGQMLAFMAVAALFSYLMATLGYPLQDATFHALDRSLGLDWLAFLKAVDARPLLGTVLSASYASFIPQVLVLMLGLSFCGQGMVGRTTILAMMLAGIVTILISGFLPAMAMFVHLGLTPSDFPNLQPGAAFVHVADMQALRSGAPVLLDLAKAEGIITFPSYHAALALLLLLGAWHNAWLRWPFLAINVAMIVATPIDGGHYFVDVIAGLAIAAVSQVVARRLLGMGAQAALPARPPTGEPLAAGH
jgi:membrane-associated phospholipid phosphatase